MTTKKILVIDDQPGNVFLLQDRLNREGFEVITAYDGDSGILKAKSDSPDLILLDIMMPGLDGFEVSLELSSNKETSHIPIIMLTALNSSEDTQKGFDCGAFDYIKKPFNKIELLARVKAALRFSETNKLPVELEKIETYSATVKKTNHEIKQPLTLINLSVSALKRQIQQPECNKDLILKKLEYIESATSDIVDIMRKMTNMDEFEITEYLGKLSGEEFNLKSKV
ncbi:MAG: response regulator [Melioribacteraceae bacterium]|nr:response regulator [Melioribacteraceae bacterium]